MGQESRHGLAGSYAKGSPVLIQVINQAVISSENWGPLRNSQVFDGIHFPVILWLRPCLLSLLVVC